MEENSEVEGEKLSFKKRLKDIYINKYKKLLIIPFSLLVIALIIIGLQIATTGDFVEKDVSLKGGITITIPIEKEFDTDLIETELSLEFPESDITVRNLRKTGNSVGLIVEASDIDLKDDPEVTNQTDTNQTNESSKGLNKILLSLEKYTGKLELGSYSVEEMGSSLGASFFKEAFKAIYLSFLLMGVVVFVYFGTNTKYKIIASVLTIITGFIMLTGNPNITKEIIGYILGLVVLGIYLKSSVPSIIVIFNVLSDFIITIAVINLINIKLSTAGVAALLMLIGYSVDTNILLSTKVLKRKEGTIIDRIFNAMKTGMTMSVTTLVAIVVAFIFTQSEIIRQIMLILFIGIIIDIINTWIQNTGILRWYLEKRNRTEDES